MCKEIGSEFWVDNIGLEVMNSKIPNWLRKFGNIVLTSSGRGAISLVLSQVTPKIKRALLPSYICDSVIIPFEEAGYELIYYDVDEYFAPRNINIKNADIGIFFHMGYFGFPTNKILCDAIMGLKSKSVIIIEDVTHTLFSMHSKPIFNDFVIGSIRKWFGIPSGGFLASNNTIDIKLPDPPIEFIDLRISSLQKKFEYIKTENASLKDKYLAGFKKTEQMLDLDAGAYGIDRISEQIIQQINIDKMRRTRKENYKYLLKNLVDIKGIKIIFETIENDITPLFFPVYVESGRDKLRSYLIKKEIYCPIHWPVPKQLEGQVSSKIKDIYNSVLSIPCDQRYDINDMFRIINVIHGWG